jgi:probable HAF family extracellular repeat protein
VKLKIRRATAICGLIAIVMPLQLVAQHTRHKLIDLGTFGGPTSQVNGGAPPMINNRGVVAGMADSSTSCLYLGGAVSPAFMWQNGTLTDLGLLPGGCFSLPDTINSKGMIAGVADIGILDPVGSR